MPSLRRSARTATRFSSVEMPGARNKKKKKKSSKKRYVPDVKEAPVVGEEEEVEEEEVDVVEVERDGSLPEYEDEVVDLAKRGTTIENYFNQGKLKGSCPKSTVGTRKKKRKPTENKEENDDCCDITQCDLQSLSEWFEKCDDYIPDEVVQEYNDSKRMFTRWLIYLATGFNLIVFGLGSKRKLLESFCEDALEDYTHLIVDGFQPTVNSHTIFQCLETSLSLKVVVMSKNQLEYASGVGRAIDERKEDVIVVLHNIDGPGFRPTLEQWALAEFAKSKYTHIIATVDHINNSLLWTQKLLNAFNFLFFNVNTMQAYKAEVYAGDSKLLGLNQKNSGNAHTFASLDVVWMSLTSNSRSLLHLIASFYFRRKKSIEFFELYRLARDEFLVSTDTALRQHLNEYNDHRLIERKRESDGNEYISVAVDEKTMTAFMKEKGMLLDEDDGEDDDEDDDNDDDTE